MTQELIPTPIKTKGYEFDIINGLKEQNDKMKEAINDVIDLINGDKGVPYMYWVRNRLIESLKLKT